MNEAQGNQKRSKYIVTVQDYMVKEGNISDSQLLSEGNIFSETIATV